MPLRLTSTILLCLLIFVTACAPTEGEYNNRGNTFYDTANYDDALQEYSSAKNLNPELGEPYYNSGNAYHRQDDLENSIHELEQALRLTLDNDELAQKTFFNLGNNYFLLEDWGNAIKYYQEALLLNPADQDAKHNLELALKNAMAATRQQGQQGGGQGQQPPEQPGNGQGQQPSEQNNEGEEQENEGGNQPDEESEQEGGGGADEENRDGLGGDGELTKDEAEQILDNLSQNSQTLQERLNDTYDAQGRRLPPAQDW